MADAPHSFRKVAEARSAPEAGAMRNVTELLGAVGEGDDANREELYRAVYAELRAIAARKMASERPGHTLQPTALVHEAWLSFGARTFKSRAHFFAVAGEVMRHKLVDSARRRSQHKRGGNLERVEFFEASIAAPAANETLLMVNEALDILAREDSLKAEIVKLRYFVGLKHQEIADALEVNEKTVRRHWEVARVRLFQLIATMPGEAQVEVPDESPATAYLEER
jgi:RNA polymerase sigma factor (TIGR02999 family)